MSGLYTLKDKYLEVLNMIDDDVDEQLIQDTLESIEGEIQDKALNYGKLIRNLETNNDGLTSEIKRLQQRKKSNENFIRRLKESLEFNMQQTGLKRIDAGLFKFSIQKNPPSIDIHTEQFIPEQFYKVERTVSKKDLLDYLKSGKEIKGVEITQHEGLRVR